MFRKWILALLVCGTPIVVWSQRGGDVAYSFLSLPSSAKAAAMGNAALLPLHNDVNQAAHMPALLDSALHKQVAVNYANFFTQAHYVQASTAWHSPRWGTFAATVQNFNYGSFVKTNDLGGEEGNFYANEIAVMGHYAQQFSPVLHVGITVKVLLSQLEHYTSWGLAMDVACRYQSLDRLTNVAFVVKNAGAQLSTYYAGSERQPLPLNVQLALSHKLAAAPFGISLTINHLQNWHLYQSSQTVQLLNNNNAAESGWSKAGKELLSHLAIGLGLYPSPKFFVMAGYNFLIDNELRDETRRAGSGLSVGGGIRIKRTELCYSWGGYNVAGGAHSVSLLIQL
ncbi:hypothetical protein AGMMS4956_11420 [Bacteroidia bacterium]|nr:hypothetical protein AGMMS4956_11420 [Bacteroidia bacterium]